jgi:selenophosphate synthetase-related protein
LKTTSLKDIINEIKNYPGITRKRNIHLITDELNSVKNFGNVIADFGEDAAVIKSGDQYLLLAVDGMWSGLIETNPYNAGKASIMVNVNDIYAMGGRPIALINVIGVPDDSYFPELVRGLKKGCEKFRVPMVGGHLHPDTKETSLSVSILGMANKLLLSNNAQAEQDIIFAVDMAGQGYQCKPVISWDTNSGKTTEQVLERLEVLPMIAEKGLCTTAKDVSNGGLLGTIALLLETSKKGANVNLNRVPKPDGFIFKDWLKAFLSYGFILTSDKTNTSQIISEFTEKDIEAAVIGEIKEKQEFRILFNGEDEVLYDLKSESLTGL